MVITVLMVTTVTSKAKLVHTKHIDNVETEGASIVWYGGIYLGFALIMIGLVWFFVLTHALVLTRSMLLALIIILIGIGIIVSSIWLRKVILASLN